MPSRRFFVAFALVAVIMIAGAAVDMLRPIGLIADGLLLIALWIDHRRAAGTTIQGRRRWPPLLVQGTPVEIHLDLDPSADRNIRIKIRDGLHPGLSEGPKRTEITVPGDGHATWSFTITPRNRGSFEVLPVTVRVLGPFGLAWAQRDIVPTETRRVYPQIRWQGKLGRLLVLAHRHQLGSVQTTIRGQGSEPYALRDYRRGDPRRSIHWKATARHGRPIVREDVLERGGRLIVLVDCGRAMTSTDGNRSKLDHALASALAVVRVAAARGDRVTLAAFDNRVRRVSKVRGGGRGISSTYGTFFDLEARLVEPAYDLAADLVASLERRSATIILLTSVVDLAATELLTGALKRLGRQHRPLLVNLEDPQLGRLARDGPGNAAEAFARVASLQILLENRRLSRKLRRWGIRCVSAPADRLALETVEGYLALSQRR